jgi:hypothetical protein
MKSLSRRIYLAVFLSLAFLYAAPMASAEVETVSGKSIQVEKLPEAVKLRFRILKAWTKGDGKDADQDLGDLEDKLHELDYKYFKLISSEDHEFVDGQRHKIRLGDGDLLSVKLIYQNPRKLGIWYHWEDADGAELIDTRLHFSCKRPLVTVVDAGNGEGELLAINIVR